MTRIGRGASVGALGLAVLLGLTTWDEGGSAPTGLLVWHAVLVALLLVELLRPRLARESACGVGALPKAAFALYAGVLWLAAWRAPYGYAAWLQFVEVGAFAAIVMLAARAGRDLPRRIAWPLLGIGAAQACLALVQRFAFASPRPAGTLLNPNHLGAWLGAVLLLAAGEALAGRLSGRHARLLTVALGGPVVVALGFTGSRGALAGVVAGSLVLLATAWPSIAARARRPVLAAVALVLLVTAGGTALRLARAEPFRYQRTRIWRAAVELAMEHPWTGSGPGQFRSAARRYQFPDGDGPLRFDRGFATTHSDLLRVPAELGIPGTVVALVVVAGCGVEVVRRWRAAPGTMSPGALAALTALGAQATVDNLSTRAALCALAACLAGVLLSTPRPRPAVSLPVRSALAVALLTAFLVGDVAPYGAWSLTRGLDRERTDAESARRLERALKLNPLHPDNWRRRAEQVAGDGTSWNVDGYVRAREAAEHAIRLAPASPEYLVGLARIETIACRSLFAGDPATRARAVAAYELARALDPRNAVLSLELAESLLDCGDPAGAARAAEHALGLEPEAAAPRLVLAAALLEAGAPEGRSRAASLLAEAEDKASTGSAWIETTPYAARLLRLERGALERVRRRLEAIGERG